MFDFVGEVIEVPRGSLGRKFWECGKSIGLSVCGLADHFPCWGVPKVLPVMTQVFVLFFAGGLDFRALRCRFLLTNARNCPSFYTQRRSDACSIGARYGRFSP